MVVQKGYNHFGKRMSSNTHKLNEKKANGSTRNVGNSLKRSMVKLPKFHKCTSQQVGIVIGNEDVGSVKVSRRTSLAQVRKSNRAGLASFVDLDDYNFILGNGKKVSREDEDKIRLKDLKKWGGSQVRLEAKHNLNSSMKNKRASTLSTFSDLDILTSLIPDARSTFVFCQRVAIQYNQPQVRDYFHQNHIIDISSENLEKGSKFFQHMADVIIDISHKMKLDAYSANVSISSSPPPSSTTSSSSSKKLNWKNLEQKLEVVEEHLRFLKNDNKFTVFWSAQNICDNLNKAVQDAMAELYKMDSMFTRASLDNDTTNNGIGQNETSLRHPYSLEIKFEVDSRVTSLRMQVKNVQDLKKDDPQFQELRKEIGKCIGKDNTELLWEIGNFGDHHLSRYVNNENGLNGTSDGQHTPMKNGTNGSNKSLNNISMSRHSGSRSTPSLYSRRNNRLSLGLHKSLYECLYSRLYDYDNALIMNSIKNLVPGTRQWFIDEYYDPWVKTQNNNRFFILAGDHGSGKTSISCKIVHDRPKSVIAHHFCRHDDERWKLPKLMLLSIGYQIAEHIPEYKRIINESIRKHNLNRSMICKKDFPISSLFDLICNPLLELPCSQDKSNPETRIIIIDGLDECCENNENNNDGKNIIVDCINKYFIYFPEWIKCFVTTTPKAKVLQKMRKFNARMIKIEEKHNNIEDLRIYTRERIVSSQSSTLINDFLHMNLDGLVENLIDLSRGNMLYIELVVNKLISSTDMNEINRFLQTFPHGCDDVYLQLFKNLDEEFQSPNVDKKQNSSRASIQLLQKILTVIVAAERAMEVPTLCAFCNCSYEEFQLVLEKSSFKNTFFCVIRGRVHLKNFVLKQLILLHITKSKKENEQSKEQDLGIFHFLDMEEARKFIAKRCITLLNELGITCSTNEGQGRWNHTRTRLDNSGYVTDYVLRHGISHLVDVGMFQEGRKIVLDIGWLMSRTSDVNGVSQDFRRLENGDRVMELIGKTFALSSDALRNDQRQLPSQLIGRLKTTFGQNIQKNEEVMDFLEKLTNHDMYGFSWWCPVSGCWEGATCDDATSFKGHTNCVQAVALSKDQRMVLSGSLDNTVRVWDPKTGDRLKVINVKKRVYSICWNNNDTQFAAGCSDGSIQIYSIQQNYELIKVLQKDNGYQIHSVDWSKDNSLIASGCDNGNLRLWCMLKEEDDGDEEEKEDFTLPHPGRIFSVAFSSTAKRIASGSNDSLVRIFDLRTRELTHILQGHSDWVRSVAWSPDNFQIVSGSADHTVRIWESMFGEIEQVLSTDENVWSVVHLGHVILSGSGETIKIWDVSTGSCMKDLVGHRGPISNISSDKSGSIICSASVDKSIRIWETDVDEMVSSMGGHTGSIWSISLSRDGRKLVSGSADKTIQIWDTKTGICKKVLGSEKPVWSVHVTPVESRRIAAGTGDPRVFVYNLLTGGIEHKLEGHDQGPIWSVQWSPCGALLASGSRDKTVRIWRNVGINSMGKGKCVKKLEGHDDDVKTVCWRSDGSIIASGTTRHIYLWDIVNWKLIRKLSTSLANNGPEVSMSRNSPTPGFLSMSSSPDGKYLVSSGTDKVIRLWNFDSGECELQLMGHERRVNSVDFSSDGTKIVSGSGDKTVRVWDIKNESCENVLKGHTGLGVYSVQWIPGTQTVLSASTDKTLRAWDLESSKCTQVLTKHTGLGIYTIAWSPDETKVCSGSRDRTVQIWNAKDGKLLHTLKGHVNWVHSVYWKQDGTQVASIADDNSVRIWDVKSGETVEVLDCCQKLPPSFPVAPNVSTIKDLSGLAPENEPVGIYFDRVLVNKRSACAWKGKHVHFFKLIEDGTNKKKKNANNIQRQQEKNIVLNY